MAELRVPTCGFAYRGDVVNTRFAVDTYCSLIARIWKDFPERRPALQSALNSYTSFYRRGFADSPEKLFPTRPASWRRDKYRQIAEGAFVDINLSNAQKLDKLRMLISAAGLRWESDVTVYGF